MYRLRIEELMKKHDLSLDAKIDLIALCEDVKQTNMLSQRTRNSVLFNPVSLFRTSESIHRNAEIEVLETQPTLHSNNALQERTLQPQGQSEYASNREKHLEKKEGQMGRYQDLGPLGRGGMGEVRRVLDPILNCELAMKIIHNELMVNPNEVSRFVEEAQVCAQLQHPSICPVHELGELPDGRLYFTMQEVKGRRLSQVIREVHASVKNGQWQLAPSGWSFRRLIGAFHTICEAVAYAHEKGVIHRDIKPSNVMIGEYGEVVVMDWGLAKVHGRTDPYSNFTSEIVTSAREQGHSITKAGSISGTPAYMSPEQARGENDKVNELSDIYSLGTILYEILVGHSPYIGLSTEEVLEQVRSRPPLSLKESLQRTSRPAIPEELIEICEKSMEWEANDRFDSVMSLQHAIQDCLDGVRKREQALQKVQQSRIVESQAEFLLLQSELLRREAQNLLRSVKTHESESKKSLGWSKEDEAASLERQAEIKFVEWEQLLHAALIFKPDLSDAHEILSAHYHKKHQEAEELRDDKALLQAKAKLKHHASLLDKSDVKREFYFQYIRGKGAITLVTNPEGAEVLLEKFEVKNRRLIATPMKHLGYTPLISFPIEMGSYMLRIRKKGYHTVSYPIFIERSFHWDGIPPSSTETAVIQLPPAGSLMNDDIYIPAGWFYFGGDPVLYAIPHRKRSWQSGFIVKRDQVTNREYLAFLNHLVSSGQTDKALQFAPRERGGMQGDFGPMCYMRNKDGFFDVAVDSDGDSWNLDWPVLHVDWFSAVAYSKYLREQQGLQWRLLTEVEWEKAARGVDGRYFPWGDRFDPSWCCMKDSHVHKPLPTVSELFPVDTSVYGVRGMAGNVRDWTSSPWEKSGPVFHGDYSSTKPRVVRGGCWSFSQRVSRVVFRSDSAQHEKLPNVGFRLARNLSF